MATLDTTNNLITLNELKDYLGTDTGSTSNDGRFNDLINKVSWEFNTITDRKLKERSHTEYRDGNGLDYIYTNEWPIVSVSTDIDIRIDADRDYTTGDKVDSTSIIIYSTEGKIHLEDQSFAAGEQSVKLVYTAGYSTIPHDLSYAAKEYCRLLWKREQSNRIGIKSESVEGGSITYEDGMPWSVRQILNLYKRREV